jgi:hypothetical protein
MKNTTDLKITICIAGALLLAAPQARAFTPAGYPGAVWTQTGRDTSGIDGTNTQGFVRQGVELLRLDNGDGLQVYGRYNWRLRSINKDYFNSYTPYVGAMYSFKYVDLGADFGWPNYTGIANGSKDYSLFANWFRYWGLKEWRKEDLVKALQLSTWGNASYDLMNQNGSSTMGWVKLEADTFWLPHDYVAGPYAAYDWRLRSKNADYFNFGQAAAGFEIGNGEVELGAQYAWRNYPKLNTHNSGLEFFISVFKTWDLKGPAASKNK